ncbi:MAG: metallophosphoesterase [Candidatus Odinarchaeota archaeon]|nr:metallophosphoesterase [Candidatus Odinarchaeota archaeon]
MKFAIIGDLHLPKSDYYPEGYFTIIRRHIEDEKPDVFLITGDLAWGREYREAVRYLKPIFDLKVNYKIAVRGNHDKWFSIEVKRFFRNPKKLLLLDGDSFILKSNLKRIGIAGIMGWYDFSFSDADITPSPADIIMTRNEAKKLRAALREINDCEIKIVIMHFSPIKETVEGDPLISKAGSFMFFEIAKLYDVNYIFHSHTHSIVKKSHVKRENIKIYNTSAVSLNFKPLILNIS